MNHIVLFEPEKPANVGNIIRTCMAMDAKLTIIGNLTFEISDRNLRRAEMDYAIGFDIERCQSLEEFMTKHPSSEVFYVTRYSAKVYSDYDLSDVKKERFFLFGKESTGIPKDVLREHYDHTMRIPMAIDARSLNLSNSVAIVLSEALRQQNFPNLATTETIKGKDFLFRIPQPK